MSPAAIAHIADLDHEGIVKLAASLRLHLLLLKLLSHFLDGLSGLERLLTRRLGLGCRLRIHVDANIDVVDLFAFRKILVLINGLLLHASGIHGLLLLLSSLLLLAGHLLTHILLLLCSQVLVDIRVHTISGGAALGALDVGTVRLAG